MTEAAGAAALAASGAGLLATLSASARRAALRCFHQRGTITSMPARSPKANAASTTSTSGARHSMPKKKCTVASCWLFSAKANRVKKWLP